MENNCESNPACDYLGTRIIAGKSVSVYQCGASDEYEYYIDEDSNETPPPDNDPLSFKRAS